MNGNGSNTFLKNLVWAVVSFLLAVLTIRLVLKQNADMSLSEFAQVVRSSDMFFLALGGAAAVVYVLAEGAAIRSILKYSGYPKKILNGMLYSTADIYFSAITPSATGGQPASAFFMMRDGIPAEMTTAVLVLNLMMYTISIVVLGIGSIFIAPTAFMEFSTFSKVLIALGFIALTSLAIVFFSLLKKGNIIFAIINQFILFFHDRGIIKDKKRKLARLGRARRDYMICSEMISCRKRILFWSFFWNFIQRASQITVPMLIYRALGGRMANMAAVFSKQCLITIGYNFVPVPGGIGISDYLMFDGFNEIMGESMAYSVELISRGFTFYLCVLVSGLITLIGYIVGRNKN